MPLKEVATGRVIQEVKLRPVLWDQKHEHYKHKNIRQQAWVDVSTTLIPNYGEMTKEQQCEVDKAIQQRWKTARDAFMRNKALLKSGASVKKYYYFDHCSFLDQIPGWYKHRLCYVDEVMKNRRSSQAALRKRKIDKVSSHISKTARKFQREGPSPSFESVKEEPIFDIEEETEENNHGADNCNDIDALQLHTEIELEADILKEDNVEDAENSKVPENQHREKEVDEIIRETARQLSDDNMCFFMSMLPIVNKFSDQQKLMFRCKVLEVAMQITEIDKQGN